LEPITFNWRQIAGPQVQLSDPYASAPSFAAPLVGPSGEKLTFELIANDGIDPSPPDIIDIYVENENHPPVVNAGNFQTKDEMSLVTLDGSASYDPDGDALTFNWTQISGPAVSLSDVSSPTPSFTAPVVGPGGADLAFTLSISDGLGGTDSGEVTIHVSNVNDPPNCNLAYADPARLWPPNHSLVQVRIVGLADPNNDQVTITVSGVTQDEPLNGLGDGDTSPDAIFSDGILLVRTERAGGGNGRVYKISFQADDAFGEGCAGTVIVCVPHDRKDPACIDDGQIFSSTAP